MKKGHSFVAALTRAGIIAALYALLSLVLYPLSFGPVQLRLSEAMCVLPLFFPEAVIGLFAGCIVTNLFSSAHVLLDVLFGSAATLLAALCTRRLRSHRALALIFPVIFNAFIVGFVLSASSTSVGSDAFFTSFIYNVFTVGLGEAAAVYGVGLPIILLCEKKYPQIFNR